MNQQIFKCLNCSCHFSVEKKSDRRENGKSNFI
uniref:Uncharacterized protein n=1 Tax=Megaselia scalaris TaxID=36166 RepID=T1GXZ8_MEGSC